MFRNFLKITWRSQVRSKSFSLLNIFGLAVGAACSLLIILWVRDEKGIDNFHENGDRLYILYERQFLNHIPNAGYGTEGLLANELKQTIPDIELASSFAWITDDPDRLLFEVGDKAMKFDGCYADADYFKMMSFPLLEGNMSTALNSPSSISISETMAKAFFGDARHAINKTITYENKKDLLVTAVFKDVPSKASTKYDFIINWKEFLSENPWATDWGNTGINTIILLRKTAKVDLVKKQLKGFLDKYKGKSANYNAELEMQPFGDSYLNSTFKDGYISGGRVTYVKLFSLIAIFILIVACINFMNLATARSIKRGKEIGVRKVVGASKFSLVRQLIGEALVVATISVFVALLLVVLSLPAFNQLTGKNIEFPYADSVFWINVLALISVMGILSGSYPAFVLASFNPITVLKGKLRFGKTSLLLRKGLVVFQFTLSMILIIGTILIAKQMKYVRNMNLGYDRENLIYLPMDGDLPNKYEVFKQEALNAEGIKSISWSGELPTAVGSQTWGIDWEGKDPNMNQLFTQTAVGYDYVKTLNLDLLEGRDFSKQYATDSTSFLVNEAALKVLGFKDPIGKTLNVWGKKGQIVGILKDFHFSSLHERIAPLILRSGGDDLWGHILIRLESGKTHEAIENLKAILKTVNPKMSFTFSFVDEAHQRLYEKEAMVSRLCDYFAFLGIFISCLGLFGLTMFTAQQRTKEFAIRKTLGANPLTIFGMQLKEVILLIFISLLIASPLGWWAMQNWLQSFAYHTSLDWRVFAIASFAVLIIAVFTVASQAMSAALKNPTIGLNEE